MVKNFNIESTQQQQQIFFSKPWHILKPKVYRYMYKEFVDNFFKDGSLRLSSFQNFAEHSNEKLKDTGEGREINRLALGSEGNDGEVYSVISFGSNAYVLCGSTNYTNDVYEIFSNKSIEMECIKIHNTTAFCESVSSSLLGFTVGNEGMVIYNNNGILTKDNMLNASTEDLMKETTTADGKRDISKLVGLVNRRGFERLFYKDKKICK